MHLPDGESGATDVSRPARNWPGGGAPGHPVGLRPPCDGETVVIDL